MTPKTFERQFRRPTRADVLSIVCLVAWPLAYYWPVTLGRSVWLTTDVLRLFYPFGVELSRALSAGRLPLWTTGILAGLPLFAEGEVGALYPVNLFLYRVLPPQFALSYSVLLHLIWAGVGMYLFARSLGLRPTSALVAGLVFSGSGFIFGHLSHPSVIAAAAWLPWQILFLELLQRREGSTSHQAVVFLLATVTVALAFLSGSVQVAFLDAFVFCLWGLAGGFLWNRPMGEAGATRGRTLMRSAGLIVISTGLPLALGGAIAAVQLLPTAELVQYSTRSSIGLDFATSFSLPPAFLQGLVNPFFQGEPAEATGEFWTYFGLAPLALAVTAPLLRRDRRTLFLAALGLGSVLLALGGATPLYGLLLRLPLVGLFRVPARYLLLLAFAGAVLSAIALDKIADRFASGEGSGRAALVAAIAGASTIGLVYSLPLEEWLHIWERLPLVFGAAVAAVLLWSRFEQPVRKWFPALICGLVIIDLGFWGAPFLATIDALTPAAYVDALPRSIAALEAGTQPERVLTDLSEFPSVPALRNSLFPNTSLIYGWSSGQAYTSLSLARNELYMNNLSPGMVDLANVRYVFVPLEPRSASRSLLPSGAVAVEVADRTLAGPPIQAESIELASFTENAGSLSDGTVIAEVSLHFAEGEAQTWPIRLGQETADWDYARKSVLKEAQHSQPPTAHAFPAYWRSFGRSFQGYSYASEFVAAPRTPSPVTGISIRVLHPEVGFTVERLTIKSERGLETSVARWAGRNDFSLAYLSDTVAVWENHSRLPRAFIVHQAQVATDNETFERLAAPGASMDQVVLLSEGSAMEPTGGGDSVADTVRVTAYEPERVALTATTQSPGYVVLSDSWYPGWKAWVDGQPAPIYRANLMFRAVPVGAGTHTIIFEYRPESVVIGAGISLSSLAAALGVAWLLSRKPSQRLVRSVAGSK